MKAFRRVTVRTRLPDPLGPIGTLIGNLRWSWHAPTQEVFAAIDPELWETVAHDPTRLLGAVPSDRLSDLANDDAFVASVRAAADELQAYLTEPRWYQSLRDGPRCIAYFSPEYGISEVLPQYSGGLGILAGDHLKTASDLGVPIVGVGLLYRSGYFQQSLSESGWQEEHYPPIDPHGLPITLLRRPSGDPATIEIQLPNGPLVAQIWHVQVGRVPLLLLDSDVEGNGPYERSVTDRLYGGGSDHRLVQEILLGIGGVRALRVYCELTGSVAPEVFHSNEGHAGFLGLERISEYTAQGLTFDEALQLTRASTIFTTHTPVDAGIDRFPMTAVSSYLCRDGVYRDAAAMPPDRILELGAEPDASLFNMAHMGLRLAARANGVSRLHGHVSRRMFGGLWPALTPAEIPIGAITNGVHGDTWVAPEARAAVGAAHDGDSSAEALRDERLWDVRAALRGRLVDEVRRRLRASWLGRGASDAELGWVEDVLDPTVLTVGFARRVPSYKRLTLILSDRERLSRLLLDPDQPVQVIVAGKAHPADDSSKGLIQELVRFTDSPELRHRIVFLPDYDMAMARILCAGSDVWLNNPLRPLEACGTSGMKAALNGALNLSVRDGWWDELYDGSNGWAIPSADDVLDGSRRDDLEASALYDLLEKSVRPAFYERSGELPTRWTAMMRHALRSLVPNVLSTRMLEEYVEALYVPAATNVRAIGADDFAGSRDIAAWASRVRSGWGDVGVTHVESSSDEMPTLGGELHIRATVTLGALRLDDVRVDALHGSVDDADELRDADRVEMSHMGEASDGMHVFETTLKLERPGAFGYTARVLPHHPAAPTETLGLAALPAM
jgi:glycogen phosphorylase